MAASFVQHSDERALHAFLVKAKQDTARSRWANIYKDVLQSVFSFLDGAEQMIAQQVCKSWRLIGLDCGIFHLRIPHSANYAGRPIKMLTCPKLVNLLSLSFDSDYESSGFIDWTTLELPRLTRIKLSTHRGNFSMKKLALFPQLREIDIRVPRNLFTGSLPQLAFLRMLTLRVHEFPGAEQFRCLADCKQLVSLQLAVKEKAEEYDICEGLKQIASLSLLASLKFEFSQCANECVLDTLSKFPALTRFSAADTELNMSDDAIEGFDKWRCLRELILSTVELTVDQFESLCAAAYARHWQELDCVVRAEEKDWHGVNVQKLNRNTSQLRVRVSLASPRISASAVKIFRKLKSAECSSEVLVTERRSPSGRN